MGKEAHSAMRSVPLPPIRRDAHVTKRARHGVLQSSAKNRARPLDVRTHRGKGLRFGEVNSPLQHQTCTIPGIDLLRPYRVGSVVCRRETRKPACVVYAGGSFEIIAYPRVAAGKKIVAGLDDLDAVDVHRDHFSFDTGLDHIPVCNSVFRALTLFKYMKAPKIPSHLAMLQ